MIPHERSLVKKLTDKPFALIGINGDSDRTVADKLNVTWRSFWNGPGGTDGPISKDWHVDAWGGYFVLDAKGVIRFKGSLRELSQLDEVLTELMAEMGHEVDLSSDEE